MANAVGAIPLSNLDLVVSASLVVLVGGVSLVMRLGLERRLLVASLRTVIQLLLIGYVLRFVFRINHPALVLGVVLVMIAVATHAAVRRSSKTYRGAMGQAFVSLITTGIITTYLVTGVVIGVRPWYQPQYMIPLLGMILGNSLTAISLCLDHVLEMMSDKQGELEMELALGATGWEAARRPLSQAVRKGMIPTINAMMVVGIVSLPGMMTGQILAGADPLEAVKYQILVMFMIAAATALGCLVMAVLIYRRLFNNRHQLQSQLIKRQG